MSNQRTNPPTQPQPQVVIVKRTRRQNHDGQLASTQTDPAAQQPSTSPPVTTVVTTQTRATLPPYAVAMISEANQRQKGDPQPYHIKYKNTSLSIAPNSTNAGRLAQNAGVFSQNDTGGGYYNSDQLPVGTKYRRGLTNIAPDAVTSTTSVQTDYDPFAAAQPSLGGDTFTRLVSEWDDVYVSDSQKRDRDSMEKSVARGLECLYDVDHFFIQPGYSEDFADALVSLRNKYDVLDSKGQRVYYVGELWNDGPPHSTLCSVTPKFSLKLFDYKCAEVMSIQGKWGAAQMFLGSDLLGFIEEDYQCCKRYTDFLVKDDSGDVQFKLVHEIGSKEAYSYEVLDSDMAVIGRISKLWSGLDVSDASLAYSYGVSFPVDITPQKKGLLLSALFVLYFKFVADAFREIRAEKCGWFTIFCCCFFMLLLIAGFSFLAAYLFTR